MMLIWITCKSMSLNLAVWKSFKIKTGTSVSFFANCNPPEGCIVLSGLIVVVVWATSSTEKKLPSLWSSPAMMQRRPEEQVCMKWDPRTKWFGCTVAQMQCISVKFFDYHHPLWLCIHTVVCFWTVHNMAWCFSAFIAYTICAGT